mgnify:CR=1 FL=1
MKKLMLAILSLIFTNLVVLYATPNNQVCKVKVLVFHDFNGNGKWEYPEITIPNVTIRTSSGIWRTRENGTVIVNIPCWSKVLEVILPLNIKERYNFLTPSVERVEYIEGYKLVVIKSFNETVNVPLAYGPFTFPLNRFPRVISPFGEYRPRGKPIYHVGTDFEASQGERVYAPAPGRVLSIERDIYYGQCILIEILYLRRALEGKGKPYMYAICHIRVPNNIKLGTIVKRGQLIGYVYYPGKPHIHFQIMGTRYSNEVKELVSLPIYMGFKEIYTTSNFFKECKVRVVPHPGYWTLGNIPIHFHLPKSNKG